MKRRLSTLGGLILGTALSVSCSGDGGGAVDPGGDTGTGVVTKIIDPGGGSIAATTSNGTSVSLNFPEGAVGAPIAVTLRPVDKTGDAFFGMLLEPAGTIFLGEVAVTVTVPDGVAFTDQQLFFGDPADPVLIPTTRDAGPRTLTTAIRSFGIPIGNIGIATSPPANEAAAHPAATATPPNNLGGMQQNCQQTLAQAQASFDSFLSQEDYEGAINSALESAALLQQSVCLDEAQQWIDTVADLTCTRFQSALDDATSTSISGYGDFYRTVGKIINWAGVGAQLSPSCQATFDYLNVLDGEIDDFLSWYDQRLQTLTGPNLSTYSDLKQEHLRLSDLLADAMTLALTDGALKIEEKAINPTLVQMRESAYGLGRDDYWHYALTKLVTYGYFAGRDIIGYPDPRLCDDGFVPPRCYSPPSRFGVLTSGPFTNDDIYEDLQFCATDIEFSTLVASDTAYTTEAAGGKSPGQKTDKITVACPTRGTIEINGEIGALTCFPADEDADNEIVFELAGTEVFALRRPVGGDKYLDGTPAEIDIIQAAADAGITPSGGNSSELKIIRHRTNCSDLLWGDQDFTLLTATLQWVNPTLEVEVQMPQSIDAGQTVNVDVRVKVIDQLGKAGFFDAIDVVLQSAGGTLQTLSGQTDAQGYFHTQITADNLQAIAGQGAAATRQQGVLVDATATSFEGVTAQGTATATIGGSGTTKMGNLSYTGEVRVYGLDQVTLDRDEYINPTNPGGWAWNGSVQADSTTGDGRSYSGSADLNVNTNLVVAGDVLTSFSGSISGSTQLTAAGAHTNDPSAGQCAELYIAFEVLGGDVPYTLTASTSVTNDYDVWVELIGDGLVAGYARTRPPEVPPASVNSSGVLPPGSYSIGVFSRTHSSCTDCSANGTNSINFSLSLGAN